MRASSPPAAGAPAHFDISAFGHPTVAPSTGAHGQPDESRLIANAIAGDRLAARALYDAHAGVIYRLAFRIVGPDLAEECTQDAFVRAFQHLPLFRRQSTLRTWLHSITVSVGLNIRRREKRRSRDVSIDFAPDISTGTPESDPLLHARIHVAIDGLPEELRTVVVLHLIQGHTHSEIAALLDIREGTSKARLSRARARLREVLADVAA